MLRPTVQSASLSWNKAPIWGLRPDLYYCQTVAGLLIELISKRVPVLASRLGPTENTALLLLKSFPWERVTFAKTLPGNGSGIFAYLAVFA
jgi:hypothetical protein